MKSNHRPLHLGLFLAVSVLPVMIEAATESRGSTTLIQLADRGLGEVPEGGFRSPEGDQGFSEKFGAKPLNNLVFELLNVESPGIIEYTFRNPREGWVHIRFPKPKTLTDHTPVAVLAGKKVVLKAVGEQFEGMRYVSEGPHSVGIAAESGPAARLEVRAIGELFYAAYGDNPHIPETGDYTWAFLKRHCLDQYNSMIGASTLNAEGTSTQEAEIKEWTEQGKRWFTLHPLPLVETADEAYAYWTQPLGMRHPLMHGIWADEFGPRLAKHYPAWNEALRRIHTDPEFSNRKVYAYCPNRFLPVEDHAVMFPFVQTLMDCGYRLGPEWYLPEGRSRPGRIIERTEDLQAEMGPGWEWNSRESFERAAPGAATNRVVVLSLLSEPGWETGDLYPNYDFNVWLDCQVQFLATDPAFFGIRGIQGYLSSYCGEEQIRLFAQLVRHYAIEGRTERMLKDPYVLKHLRNPDFEEGTAGWTVAPAVSRQSQVSAQVKTATGFGVLQAKYHAPEGAGEQAIWMKRNAERPNVISQELRGLEPGRLYSLRFITGDYQELRNGTSVKRKHAISATVESTESVADKCFQAIIGCGTYYSFGAFNRENPYWMNLHQRVFRATAKTARLLLSDWASESSAGGPENEELIWNFIQVQPYFE